MQVVERDVTAGLRRDLGERDVFGVQDAVAILEVIHVSAVAFRDVGAA